MKSALRLTIPFLLLIGTVCPLSATSISHAGATVTWSNYPISFTGNGTFSIPSLTGSVLAIDRTSQGPIPPCSFICPAFLSVNQSITLSFGSEDATASSSNTGMTLSVANVSSSGPPASALAFASEDVTFILTGNGSGTVNVTAGFQLNATCSGPGAFSSAAVILSTPGGPSDSRQLFGCNSLQTGNLSLSFPATATAQGTSVRIHFEATSQAAVAPEETSLVLTGFGLMGLLVIRKRS